MVCLQGRQPFLLHLLSLYKVFCPELVTLSVPSKMKVCIHIQYKLKRVFFFFFFFSSALWIIRSGGVLVKLHVFSSLQIEFKNHNSPWKSALMAVQKRNGSQVACSSLPFTLANKSNVRKRVRSSVLFTS